MKIILMMICFLAFSSMSWLNPGSQVGSVASGDPGIHRNSRSAGWSQVISDGILRIETRSSDERDLVCFKLSNKGKLVNTSLNAAGDELTVLDKKWKMSYEGTLGKVRITFKLSKLSGVPNRQSDFSLLIDNDNDLSNGFQVLIPCSNISNGYALFDNVEFGRRVYFTFATALDSQ